MLSFSKTHKFTIFFLFIFIAFLWFFYPIWGDKLFSFIITDSSKELADNAFDRLNTLFSGLAFAGILCSIFMQSQELKSTKEELKEQKELTEKQNFESTFFQLLGMYNNLIFSYKKNDDEQEIVGRQVFQKEFNNFLERHYDDLIDDLKNHYIEKSEDSLYQYGFRSSKCILDFSDNFFSIYLDQILSILKYIDDEKNLKNPDFYSRILKTQLSEVELNLIIFFCLTNSGSSEFKKLIEKYSMLENLKEIPSYMHEEKAMDCLKYIDKKAFGKNSTNLFNFSNQSHS